MKRGDKRKHLVTKSSLEEEVHPNVKQMLALERRKGSKSTPQHMGPTSKGKKWEKWF